MSGDLEPKINNYAALLAEIKERVRTAQYHALKAVNKELVGLYWGYVFRCTRASQ